jgi:hypothetical protein
MSSLRACRVSGGADDSTVKLRPVDPATIADGWKKTPGFEIELDRVGEIDDVARGGRPIRSLFSMDQERLIAETPAT